MEVKCPHCEKDFEVDLQISIDSPVSKKKVKMVNKSEITNSFKFKPPFMEISRTKKIPISKVAKLDKNKILTMKKFNQDETTQFHGKVTK